MAWTLPRTWTTGELVTAAMMNTHVRDNFNTTPAALVTTKGDIVAATAASALDRVGVGSDRDALVAFSGCNAGMRCGGMGFVMWGNTGATNLSTTTKQFMFPGGTIAPNATEAATNFAIAPANLMFSTFRIRLNDAAPGAGKTYIFTVRIAQADSTLIATASGTDTSAVSTASATASSGGILSLSISPTGTPTATTMEWSLLGYMFQF